MILVPIVEKYSSFTKTEQRIADFILNNSEETLKQTATQLAISSGTSPAAIIRFSRKLGYSGFTDMKLGLAKFFQSDNQLFEKDMIIKEKDSYENCASKLLAQINDVCKSTAGSIDFASLTKVIQIIDNADTIFLFGVGSSATVAMDFQQKLIRLNKKAFFLEDSQIGLLSTITISKRDVAICFSFSGVTKIIEATAQSARERGAFLISIVGNSNSPIAKTSDIFLLTPAIERKLRIGAVSSRYSQQFISDLIFLCLISNHFEEAERLTLKANSLIANADCLIRG